MELTDYVKLASFICEKLHQSTGGPCTCQGLLNVSRHIGKEGWMNLKRAFILSSPGKVYVALHARQKLLQMSVAATAVESQGKGNRRFVLVPKQKSVNYRILQSLLSKSVKSNNEDRISKEQINKLLNLAESEAER